MNTLKHHKIEHFSGVHKVLVPNIKIVKKKDYEIIEGLTIAGDAPKAFLRLYDKELNFRYEEKDETIQKMHFRKVNKKSWPLYIAKTGHKRYPQESITEHLLTRLGEDFGLCMAKTSLRIIGGQLRLLSKYFLNPQDEELIHGADIFSGYTGDKEFIQQIEDEDLARDMFTMQFVRDSILFAFPHQQEEIMRSFIRMIMFDALVGNNDRHFYNWGVKQSITRKFQPYFSPVYDTARGLFWNDTDLKLKNKSTDLKEKAEYIRKYCKNSRPKIGWEGIKIANHFKLVEKIIENSFYISRDEAKRMFSLQALTKMIETIDKEFIDIMSQVRREMIKSCLEYRIKEINKIIC